MNKNLGLEIVESWIAEDVTLSGISTTDRDALARRISDELKKAACVGVEAFAKVYEATSGAHPKDEMFARGAKASADYLRKFIAEYGVYLCREPYSTHFALDLPVKDGGIA